MRGIVRKYSPYENCLSKLEPPDIQWLMKRLKFYSHSSVCSKYHIRPHQYAKIIWYGLFDFFEKTFFILTHSRFDHPNLRNYYSKVADLEKLIKSRGRT